MALCACNAALNCDCSFCQRVVGELSPSPTSAALQAQHAVPQTFTLPAPSPTIPWHADMLTLKPVEAVVLMAGPAACGRACFGVGACFPAVASTVQQSSLAPDMPAVVFHPLLYLACAGFPKRAWLGESQQEGALGLLENLYGARGECFSRGIYRRALPARHPLPASAISGLNGLRRPAPCRTDPTCRVCSGTTACFRCASAADKVDPNTNQCVPKVSCHCGKAIQLSPGPVTRVSQPHASRPLPPSPALDRLAMT